MRRSALFVLPLLLASAAAHAGDAPCCASDLEARRAALAKEAPSLAKDEAAKRHYALGLELRAATQESAAREEFAAALAADPDHEPSHAALGDVKHGDRWIPYAEAMQAKGLVQRGGAWILREEAAILDLPAKERERRRAEQAKVEALIGQYEAGDAMRRRFALDALGAVEDRFKMEPFAFALRSKSRDVRELAAKELGRLRDRRALKTLLHRGIYDKDAGVRASAVDAAVTIGDDNLAAPMVKALGSESADTRMHAAQALARIGSRASVRYLVWKIESAGGGGPRVHSFFGNQLTYIQDFDVEVAQTAFIADPQVGTLQEGIVLDAQVHGLTRETVIVEREVFHQSLVKLTGATGVKNEPGAWAAWWKEHGEAFVAAE
ncbi:MAG: hypothetical protein HMLKMBBP_01451 [Planctomycetes bacterium]|nr:hypothetical protein [Planctomycetota bacterium]